MMFQKILIIVVIFSIILNADNNWYAFHATKLDKTKACNKAISKEMFENLRNDNPGEKVADGIVLIKDRYAKNAIYFVNSQKECRELFYVAKRSKEASVKEKESMLDKASNWIEKNPGWTSLAVIFGGIALYGEHKRSIDPNWHILKSYSNSPQSTQNSYVNKTYKVRYDINTRGKCKGQSGVKFINVKTGDYNSELGNFFGGNDGSVELKAGEYKITCYGGFMSSEHVLGRIYVGPDFSNEFILK